MTALVRHAAVPDVEVLQACANRSYRVAGLSLSEMEQIYVARLPLEAVAIRLTVPQMDTHELADLERAVTQMDVCAAVADYEGWEVPHQAFHAGLRVRAGGRIAGCLGELSDHAARYRRLRTVEGPRAWSQGVLEHRAILEACAARDVHEGARRLARHLFHTAEDVIRMIDPEYDPRALRVALAVAEAPTEGAQR